jgi:bifunctional UDP-N-acetylglucosamine pyrophosphorylase/glucosamine-1-phosphate N-acetyltransferase
VDTVIHPNVTFGPSVRVGAGVTIYPGCHLSKTTLGDGSKVGPFAHLRDGTVLHDKAEIGNFVETKNAVFDVKAKAKHLSYIGDATVGKEANIGAGTITCNYNGFVKSKTTIGPKAFIGSNTSLVAPVTVGEGAIVAAGSVIGGEIPAESLVITRGEKIVKEEWAAGFRNKWAALKKNRN